MSAPKRTLCHGWRSSASRRVRLVLAEKQLACESRLIDMVKGEQHALEYLAPPALDAAEQHLDRHRDGGHTSGRAPLHPWRGHPLPQRWKMP